MSFSIPPRLLATTEEMLSMLIVGVSHICPSGTPTYMLKFRIICSYSQQIPRVPMRSLYIHDVSNSCHLNVNCCSTGSFLVLYLIARCPSSTLFPFCFGVSLLKLNIRKKVPLPVRVYWETEIVFLPRIIISILLRDNVREAPNGQP